MEVKVFRPINEDEIRIIITVPGDELYTRTPEELADQLYDKFAHAIINEKEKVK